MEVVRFALMLLAGCIIVTPFVIGAGFALIDYYFDKSGKYDLKVINAIVETIRDWQKKHEKG